MTTKAECHGCGKDCTDAYATYLGYPYHVGCLPLPHMKAKERFCFNCGESLGVIETRYYDRTDTCGRRECEHAVRDQLQSEREDAHDRLDRDMGY